MNFQTVRILINGIFYSPRSHWVGWGEPGNLYLAQSLIFHFCFVLHWKLSTGLTG